MSDQVVSIPTPKAVNNGDLRKCYVHEGLNPRTEHELNLPAMAADIERDRKIVTHLWVMKDDKGFMILRGHRRFGGGSLLLAKKDCPVDIFENLTAHLPLMVFENLTDDQIEKIVYDHDQKPLSCAGTVMACWRKYEKYVLQGGFKNEVAIHDRIMEEMHICLTQMGGTTTSLRKKAKLPPNPGSVDRIKYLREWFAGNYTKLIRGTYVMGQFIRRQTYLTMLRRDEQVGSAVMPQELKDEQKIRIDQPNYDRLKKAMELDIENFKEKKSDVDWTPLASDGSGGGPEFNKVVEQLKYEFVNGKASNKSKEPEGPDAEEWKKMRGLFQSDLSKMLCDRGAGISSEKLADIDALYAMMAKKRDILSACYDSLPTGAVKDLAKSYLDDSPQTFEEFVKGLKKRITDESEKLVASIRATIHDELRPQIEQSQKDLVSLKEENEKLTKEVEQLRVRKNSDKSTKTGTPVVK